MKKIFAFFGILFTFASCETVVDIPLKNEEPKLVIDAVIKWQKGTAGNNQTIRLSLTNDFYTNEVVPATGATVTVTDSNSNIFNFTENNLGEYTCTNFNPVINQNYTLSVTYKGENYTATNKLYQTPTIINFQQETIPGIGGSDSIQIKFFYQDNGQEINYYLVGVKDPNKLKPQFGAVRDEFFQGNVMFGLYRNDEIKTGDTILFSLQGISTGYFNYMEKLIDISGSQGGGNPFATPPATLRGNIVNNSNIGNYPLGYFHLSEIDERSYVVQ
jgi:hypothetical protein